jgi:hypothetical protein
MAGTGTECLYVSCINLKLDELKKICRKTWSSHPEIASVCHGFGNDLISQETN